MTQEARLYASASFRYIETFTTLAFLYLSLTLVLSGFTRWLESRWNSRDTGQSMSSDANAIVKIEDVHKHFGNVQRSAGCLQRRQQGRGAGYYWTQRVWQISLLRSINGLETIDGGTRDCGWECH